MERKASQLMNLLIDGDASPRSDEASLDVLYKDSDFLDDVNKFGLLGRDKVAQARLTAMAYFRKLRVCKKVRRSEVKARVRQCQRRQFA